MATILLVDDDPLQAFLRKSILERRFSDVQRVADAVEALCLVEQPQFAKNLGLVITGHKSAGFGGPEFVAELQARLPAVRVLVLGGNGDASSDYSGVGVRFCPRPISTDELLALAGAMLGAQELKRA